VPQGELNDGSEHPELRGAAGGGRGGRGEGRWLHVKAWLGAGADLRFLDVVVTDARLVRGLSDTLSKGAPPLDA
jgi:hypothetical protein